MANFNLAYLLPSMLHKIFSMVATTSIQDFGSAIVAFPDEVNDGLGATIWVIQRPSTCDVCMNCSSSIYLMKEGKTIILLQREDACWPNM
ncbi:hypothetical protein YC2023_077299 [Brassica napus]